MKVDISRDTFLPSDRFRRVLLQQGRVQLDADFNEQIAILLHELRVLTADLVGPHGGPMGDSLVNFNIYSSTSLPPSDFPASSLPANFDADNFVIGPGHYYVGGLLCQNDRYLLYRPQTNPDLKNPLPIKPQPGSDDLPPLATGAQYVAYLHVWERLVTYVQHDLIREVALDGADTAARVQLAFSVEAHQIKPNPDPNAEPLSTTLKKNPAALLDMLGKSAGKRPQLRARIDPGSSSADEVCTLPPDSQYRGDENQLYRVEVHTPGAAGTATFVWARDNASVVFPVVTANGAVVTVETLGRDPLRGLEVEDWVEFLSDQSPAPGGTSLYQVRDVDPVGLTVTLADPQGNDARLVADPTTHPFLRRWDFSDPEPGATLGTGAIPAVPASDGALMVVESGWIDLEDGVQIQFVPAAAAYSTGDYWLIPARTATGNVEWPTTTTAGGKTSIVSVALPARQAEHFYAPLWLFSLNANGLLDTTPGTLIDLRRRIEPLGKPL
jgi:hypothetical protein